MMPTKIPSYAAAAIALLASNALLAQAPPTVVITFVDPFGVPLDPWSAVAAGLLIIAAAYALFRWRGGAAFGRLSAGLVIVATAAGALMAASRLDIVSVAHALAPTPLLLTSSPASVAVGSGANFVEAQNATGRTITIESVKLVNPAPNQVIQLIEGTNCVPGLVLPAGQSCVVSVQVLS